MSALLYDVAGQTLAHVPARPVASATWVLEDLRKSATETGRVVASGDATVPDVELALDGTAGYTQARTTKVPVASTVGAVTGPWWLESAEGTGELVWVEGVVDGEYLATRWPIVGEYEAGATISLLEIAANIPDAVTADEDNLDGGVELRVVWTYVVDAKTRRHQDLVQIARHHEGDGELAGVIEFALAYFAALGEHARAGELERWACLAKRLVGNRLRGLGSGIEPARFLVGDRAVELLAFRMLVIAAHNGFTPARIEPADHRRAMASEFERVWAELTIGHPGKQVVEIDDDDDARTPTERAGLDFGW